MRFKLRANAFNIDLLIFIIASYTLTWASFVPEQTPLRMPNALLTMKVENNQRLTASYAEHCRFKKKKAKAI